MALLAAQQHGVVTKQQALDCGFTDATLYKRLNRTLWRVGPMLYAVGHPGIGRHGLVVAGLLHAGEQAGISHASAARNWGIERRSTDGPVHISLIGRDSPSEIEGIEFHRPENLTTDDLVIHRGRRCTTPERTVIDLLPYRTEAEVSRLLEQMVTVLGRDPDRLNEWANDLGSVPGRRKLITALDGVAGPAVIKSELEDLFREVCRESGLPLPRTNYWLGGVEVDAAWLRERVVVELDSWQFHGGRWQFHHDRAKGLHIARQGYELIRLTWKQLKRDRAEVVETLSLVLARASARRRPRAVHEDASDERRW